MSVAAHDVEARIAALKRERPRSRFLRFSLGCFLLLMVASWVRGDFDFADTFSAQRGENLERFMMTVRPKPLRERTDEGWVAKPWDWDVAADWAGERLTTGVSRAETEGGVEAAIGTLAIAILAVVLAALGSLVFCWFAARNVATPQPFAPSASPPGPLRRWAWRGVVGSTRVVLILLRSMPEYILAYLIMSMLGSPAWPAVLALAIHNTGILGRLNAETIENVQRRPLVALRALGAGRAKIAAVGIWPAIMPRFLLYFFYRWETCVREATVLGILHLASLGWLIDEAKARGFKYDEMVFFILLGVVLVLVGDVVSAVCRRLVRRAS
ncbi:MAG: ABC transporter permease subunit [Planctomycetota bacterium]|nr:ABC transporter permease subunit [Planctomycetota bacterium]